MRRPRIFVADSGNNRIVRIVRVDDMTGADWTTFANGSIGGSIPDSISGVPRTGTHLYLTDQGNGRLVCVDDMTYANGVAVGSSGSGAGQLKFPSGVAAHATNVYVSDSENDRLVRLDPNNLCGSLSSFGTVGASLNQFSHPVGVYIVP